LGLLSLVVSGRRVKLNRSQAEYVLKLLTIRYLHPVFQYGRGAGADWSNHWPMGKTLKYFTLKYFTLKYFFPLLFIFC